MPAEITERKLRGQQGRIAVVVLNHLATR